MNQYAECPKCGKHTVVQRTESVFQCLSCDFKKDFDAPAKKPQGITPLGFFAFLFLLFTLLSMLGVRPSKAPVPASSIQNPSVSQQVQ
ncbi:MAG: hypothetical protein VKL59_01335 [Nostocaceae cyanobacterium]|nr:hypothetical protein [Nostocaceae cyanobacterium]